MFNLPLGGLFANPPKPCCISISQTSSAACRSYLGRAKIFFKVAFFLLKSAIKQIKSPKGSQKCIAWQSKPHIGREFSHQTSLVNYMIHLGGNESYFKVTFSNSNESFKKNSKTAIKQRKARKMS